MPPHVPTLPLSDPILVFAVALATFLVLPLLFRALRIPGLIGLIVAGAVIGPHGFGVLERDATIILLGTVGLLYLMFLVGLELDLHEFGRHRRRSVTFGVLSFLLPQLAGTLLSLALGYALPAALLLGAMFASHTLVAFPIASRLGIVKTAAVTTVLGATLLTDMLALFVLAVVAGAHAGAGGAGLWVRLPATLSVYVALVLVVVPRVGRWFFRQARSDDVAQYVFVLVMLFTFAGLAVVAGIEPIIGALLLGLALNRLIPEHGALMNRIRFVADAIFVPFFLLSVGMLVDVRAFVDPSAWRVIVVLVVATVGSKALAAKLTQRLFGFAPEEGWVMFGLSVSHAAATMAITIVGFRMGFFDEVIVNAVVVIITVTCLVGPWVVDRSGRRLAERESVRPYRPEEAPQRILIPVSNPATSDALLDLAFLLRPDGSDEPVLPLTVVRGRRGGATDADVAAAERLLVHAVTRAAAAQVPVTPLTRVDPNVASGIARGISETRSSIVVIGWDGGKTAAANRIFGSVLDQLLAQTRQLVLVARLEQPLNTTKRLLLVMPPLIDRHPGFYAAVSDAKRIAAGLSASVLVLAIGGRQEEYGAHVERVRPAAKVAAVGVTRWDEIPGWLAEEAGPDDLVILLSARPGTVAWHARLERLPARFATRLSGNFAILFPAQAAEDEVAGSLLPAGAAVVP